MISIWRVFPSSGPHGSRPLVIFASILNEDKVFYGKYCGLACSVSVPEFFWYADPEKPKTTFSWLLHSLDSGYELYSIYQVHFWKIWKTKVKQKLSSYLPSVTSLQTSSQSQSFSAAVFFRSFLRFLHIKGAHSIAKPPILWMSRFSQVVAVMVAASNISSFLVYLRGLWSDSRYELIPLMVNYQVLLGVISWGTAWRLCIST